ncbi:MAG: PAS domain S-box protein [Candidatus Riflebacteria bacterium]|nr:PAS domain S-box protein [Candidatus Riflebacteria bacterium]
MNFSYFSMSVIFLLIVMETIIIYFLLSRKKNRELAFESLAKREERYRLISENIGDVIWVLDLSTKKLKYVSPSIHRLSGYTPEEILDHPLKEILTHESFHRVSEYFQKKLPEIMQENFSGHLGTMEVEQICKNGSIVSTEVATVVNSDKNGKSIEILGVAYDITKRKYAEYFLRQSEEKFRLLVKLAPLPLGVISSNGQIEFLNDQFEKVFGYSLSDIPNIDQWWLLVYPDEVNRKTARETWESAVKTAADEKTNTKPMEFRVTCKDGRVLLLEISGITIMDKILATFVDITDRKITEETLRVTKERLQIVSDVSSDYAYLITISPEGKLKWEWVFGNIQQLLGYSESQISTSLSIIDLMPPEDQEHFQQVVKKWLSGQRSISEYRLRHKKGSVVWVQTCSTPIWDEKSERVVKVIGCLKEITERKRMEEALLQAKERMEMAMDAALAGSWHWHISTGQMVWSPQLFEIFGLDPCNKHASMNTWNSILHPEDREIAHFRLKQQMREKKSFPNEFRIIRPDGKIRLICAIGKFDYDELGIPIRMIGICVDITERQKNLDDLKSSEERFKILAESSFEGIMIISQESLIIEANQQLAEIWGYELLEIIGRPYTQFLHPDVCERAREAIESGREASDGYRGIRKDGSVFYFQARGRPAQFGGKLVRITVIREVNFRKPFESTRFKRPRVKARQLKNLRKAPFQSLND